MSATAVKNFKRCRRQRLNKIIFKTAQKPIFLNRVKIKNSKKSFFLKRVKIKNSKKSF
jgi:hypothetical protein